MNCPKCNSSNDDSAKFCASCGAPLSALVPAPANNGLAVASLVLGIVGLLLSWVLLAIPSILAIIFGHISRGQIKRAGGAQSGAGMALAGLIMGYVVSVIVVIGILAAIAIPNYMEYAIRVRVGESVVASVPVRQAIEDAHQRGIPLGQLPANPADLGLKSPESYSSAYVKSVSYTPDGQVIIQLQQHSGLGRQAGGTVVLTPVVKENRIRWRPSPASTIPRRYIPLN